MALQLIIGRAGSGKTQYCLDSIQEKLQTNPTGSPFIYLVPEQASFEADYALVTSSQTSGIIRIQSLSFQRLAYRVMQEVGGTVVPLLDETGKKLLLHKVVSSVQGELLAFRRAVGKLGFIDQLYEWFTELKRYNVGVEQFTEQQMKTDHPILENKLSDLTKIYAGYDHALYEAHIDGEGVLHQLAEQIGQCHSLKEAEIWIDGFDGFTPQEFAIIEQLMIHCKQVNITLCLDRVYEFGELPHELHLFYPPALTMQRLIELARQNDVPHDKAIELQQQFLPRFGPNSQLGLLEASYARPVHAKYGFAQQRQWNDQVRIRTAVNRRSEVESAAKEMIRLVRDEEYRFRDLAIMVRNLEDYQELIELTFADYDIPIFIDAKRTIHHHPLVEFLRSALDVVQERWTFDSVFRCIKTDLLLPPEQSREKQDQLENYVLAYGIYGSKWTNPEPWMFRTYRSLEYTTGEFDEAEAKRLEEINETRRAVTEPLFIFQTKLKRAEVVLDYAVAIFELLDSVHVSDKLAAFAAHNAEAGKLEDAMMQEQIWNAVVDLLDQIVELMGEEAMSLSMFSDMFQSALEGIELGIIPPALDQVLIGHMDRTRPAHIKHLFLLGVNDGIIPAKFPELGILSEKERELLEANGLELAPGVERKLLDEQFIIYKTLALPQDGLWLSYAVADEEGRSLQPSEVIRRVGKILPSVEPKDWEQSTDSFSHPSGVLNELLLKLRDGLQGDEVEPRWWDVYDWFALDTRWQPILKQRVQSLFYRNEAGPLQPSTSHLLYGDQLVASVSRLELYSACAFSQFASYGLQLKERQVYKLAAPDMGQLFHAALNQMALELRSQGLHWGDLTDEECRQYAEFFVDKLSPRLQNEILFSTKRHRFVARKLKNIVSETAIVLAEHARRGKFVPVGLEVGFGPGQQLPAMNFNLNHDKTMQLRGRIDRVDQSISDNGMLLRVIDYKSSARALKLSDVYYGLSLQLLTYLDVVITNSIPWLGVQGIPAGALYFHVHNPIIQTSSALTPEKAQIEVFKKYKMQGLVLDNPEAVRHMDSTLESGSSSLIPVYLRKDGSLGKVSSTITKDEWGSLRQFVRNKIKAMGNEMIGGHVEINPYQLGQRSACQFCPYRSVCQFDPGSKQSGARKWSNINNEEVWDLLQDKRRDEDES